MQRMNFTELAIVHRKLEIFVIRIAIFYDKTYHFGYQDYGLTRPCDVGNLIQFDHLDST